MMKYPLLPAFGEGGRTAHDVFSDLSGAGPETIARPEVYICDFMDSLLFRD